MAPHGLPPGNERLLIENFLFVCFEKGPGQIKNPGGVVISNPMTGGTNLLMRPGGPGPPRPSPLVKDGPALRTDSRLRPLPPRLISIVQIFFLQPQPVGDPIFAGFVKTAPLRLWFHAAASPDAFALFGPDRLC